MKNRLLFIYVAFGSSFIAIVVICLLLLRNFQHINANNNLLEHTHEVKNEILKVQTTLIEAENNLRGFLLPKDTSLLLPVSQTQKRTFREIDALKRLTADNKSQQQLIIKLKETVSSWYQVLYATMDDVTTGELSHFNINREKGKVIFQQISDLCEEMDREEANLLEKRKEEKNSLVILAPRYLGIILLVSFFFQLSCFLIIIEAYKRRRIHQQTLEQKIKELNTTNAELEQIAFVASHDLQEPLRKIRTFCDKLNTQYSSDLNEDGKAIVEKISASSQRIQELLNDLINYNQVTRNDEKIEKVDLTICFQGVCEELDNVIKQKKAVIRVNQLPVVEGYYRQLFILFYNLLDNAIKFSKPAVIPRINIFTSEVRGTEIGSSEMFIKISVSDNGIGFEKEYNEKIFIIFKRLHNNSSPLKGKGIGLATCKKIMLNHHGAITAQGETGVGATFNLYFPVNPII